MLPGQLKKDTYGGGGRPALRPRGVYQLVVNEPRRSITHTPLNRRLGASVDNPVLA